MYIYKLAVLFLLASITVVYTNCGSPFATQSSLAWQSSTILAGSQEAFEATVYPITRANCVSCHQTQSPQHASSDPKTAHDAAYMKVNFGNIPNSRLVKKLRDENHNCWSDCNSNADEMQAAITDWYDAIKDTDGSSPNPTIPPTGTPMLKTSQTRSIEMELADITNAAKTPTAEAKVLSATVTAPMIKGADGFGDFIQVPDDGSNQTLLATDNSAGIATINLRLPSAGSYRVFARLLNPDADSNAVFVGLAPQGTPTAYIGGIRTVDNIAQSSDPTYRQLVTGINVTAAGNYTLTIRERKDGLKIYKIFVTADTTFNVNDVAAFIGVKVKFDVSTLVAQPAGSVFFQVDITDYDAYTYLISNPTLITPTVNVRVKNARLMMNNVYNPQNATYNTVDKVATPAMGLLSGFPMIVLKDMGSNKDKFHFEFEMLEVYNGTVNYASLTAFTNSVYQISRANCASCHTAQVPAHASPDPLTAHDAALTVVDFNTPANSRIVTKIRNGHQTINAATGASLATQYEAAIVQWRTGRGP